MTAIKKNSTYKRRFGRFFWLYLAGDFVLAAAIVGVFFLFLKILPQARQYQKMIETMSLDGAETPGASSTVSAAVSFDPAEEEAGGQAAVIEPAEMPESDARGSAEGGALFRERFAKFFTKETVIGQNAYSSPDVSVQITRVADREHGSLAFNACIADIHVASLENLKAGFPVGHRTAEAELIAIDNDAVVAVNGDYYVSINRGILVRNGSVLQTTEGSADICVIFADGTMSTYGPGEYSAEGILNQNPWQVWSFGPALLDEDGQPKAEFNTSTAIYNRNPRTAIGYYEPGHYCLVVVDGRSVGISNGASIRALASLMADLGCRAAYNLDGGASSVMVFEGETVNQPSAGGRKISDMVMVCELPTAEMIIEGQG